MELNLNIYQTMAVAVILFYLGEFIKKRVKFFRTYCIPAPVIGGIIYAILNLVLYETGVLIINIDTTLQSIFMNVFFTSIGFTASFGMLKQGGKTLPIFLIAIGLLGILQNILGAGMCSLFGLDPKLGLALGSISLTGGHGTSAAFAPLVEEAGVPNAMTVAVAAATYGLVSGNVIGNPLARLHIRKKHLAEERTEKAEVVHAAEVDRGLDNSEDTAACGTLGVGLLFFATGVGTLIGYLLELAGISLASYIGAMIFGIIVRNVCDRKGVALPVKKINNIGTICLNFFLVLAMMGLKLYQLVDLAVPMIVILLLQTILTAIFCYFVTFNICGRDYDAAMLMTGHIGFGLGVTANAMANMDSMSQSYGDSEKAYLIIPVCGGFFLDIINALIITFFLNIL